MFTTGLVLAAGGSSRLGRPKQLLPYRDSTLLDASLHAARASGLDELIVALGGAADDIRAEVDLSGCTVVDNVRYTTGCSSSIVVALDRVDERAEAVVLLLGDQPDVDPEAVRRLSAEGAGSELAVCRYDDGRGHPFRFARSMFAELRELHGDKGVWKLIESGRWPVYELGVDGPVPLDVDTWDDYERLLETTP